MAARGKRSAGLLLWRGRGDEREVLLVHPGGPFWARRDDGAWSIPKGEVDAGEDPLACALREFAEELGTAPRVGGELVELGSVKQPGGKEVLAWAGESDFDVTGVVSNVFELEWPPKSGHTQAFPEVDRAEWFSLASAREKVNPAQAAFLDRLPEARA